MKKWTIRLRYYALFVSASGLFVFNGCGLSDQQLASIWSSVLSTGLNAVVTSAVEAAITGAA